MEQYSKEDIGGGIEEHTHHWTYSGNGYSNMMACRCDSAVGMCPVEDRMARR